MTRALPRADRIAAGRRAARAPIHRQDEVWSTHSSDKPDIGTKLMVVLRRLHKELSDRTTLRALSVGSSTEPQLPILEAACRAGVTLLDIDGDALAQVRTEVGTRHPGDPERDGVTTVRADLNDVLADREAATAFRRTHLHGRYQHLVTFHHSLYYAPRPTWDALIDATCHALLTPTGAVHAVLMSATATESDTTTALYDRWAGEFFGARNEQDLDAFGRDLRRSAVLGDDVSVRTATSIVRFDHDDFEAFMEVIWMILLHPQVHRFTPKQLDEVTEAVYTDLWSRHRPLVQHQDHLMIERRVTPAPE